MDGYEPPTYAQLVMPMIFDAQEAHRRRVAYEEFRRVRTKLWRDADVDFVPNRYVSGELY